MATVSDLVLAGLHKQFNGIPAVSDLTLHLGSGEIVALLGPSGCGKSTTLQMVAGILGPDAGVMELGGRRLNGIPPERRGVAMMLQRGLLFPHLTVGENVAFALRMQGMNRVDREVKALAMLERVQLGSFAQRRPSELSGGQAQRVALARSLVMEPQLLLLDEPLSALDANLRDQMQGLILDLQGQMGLTTLLVTHDQAEASLMAHRIGLMFAGSLHQVGSPADFYEKPSSVAAARFFGGVNFWPGEALGSLVELGAGIRLTLSASAYGASQVTIRPERVEVWERHPGKVNALEVRVMSLRSSGIQQRLLLQTVTGPPVQIQAWLPTTQGIPASSRLWAVLPPAALWCIGEGRIPEVLTAA